MSIVKRLLLVTGFWSGPFRVTLGLGRPHTLQQRTTVSPNAHTTSDRGTRNSGATAHRKHTTQYWLFSPLFNFYFYFRWKQVLFIELCDFGAGVGRHSVASGLWTWSHSSHYVTAPVLICPQFSANLNFVDLFTHNSQVRPNSGTVSHPGGILAPDALNDILLWLTRQPDLVSRRGCGLRPSWQPSLGDQTSVMCNVIHHGLALFIKQGCCNPNFRHVISNYGVQYISQIDSKLKEQLTQKCQLRHNLLYTMLIKSQKFKSFWFDFSGAFRWLELLYYKIYTLQSVGKHTVATAVDHNKLLSMTRPTLPPMAKSCLLSHPHVQVSPKSE